VGDNGLAILAVKARGDDGITPFCRPHGEAPLDMLMKFSSWIGGDGAGEEGCIGEASAIGVGSCNAAYSSCNVGCDTKGGDLVNCGGDRS
jgi:hypothetical protein